MLEMREWRAPHHILFTTHTHAVLLKLKKGAILMNLYYIYFLKHLEKNSNIVSDFGGL